jgi:hypothetical protein
MFDPNQFKRAVKEWIRAHPVGTEAELVDFCEEQVPPQLYAANQWLIEHTVSWYRHILAQRLAAAGEGESLDEAIA